MRREVFALVLCACGTGTATPTFDSGLEEPPVVDHSPGPDDGLDASAPVGVACTPGSVRVVATSTKHVLDGPRVDDGYVYWSEGEPDGDADPTQGYWWGDGSSTLAVHRVDKLGANPTRLFGTSSKTNGIGLPFIAVDASSLYWLSYTAGFGGIVGAAKDGSSQTTLVSGLPSPRVLELGGSTLFFVSGTSLYSIAVDGTSEHVVAQTWTGRDYAVGATHVYGTDGETIVRVDRNGGPMETLVAAAMSVRYQGLSVGDDGYVYAIESRQFGAFSANVIGVPTAENKTPSVIVQDVQDDVLTSDQLFTTVDPSCLVYTTRAGVFRRCPSTAGDTISAIGPGYALEAPVVDTTSIYWRTQTQSASSVTTTIYAACKL